jgi:hypothetical protein
MNHTDTWNPALATFPPYIKSRRRIESASFWPIMPYILKGEAFIHSLAYGLPCQRIPLPGKSARACPRHLQG